MAKKTTSKKKSSASKKKSKSTIQKKPSLKKVKPKVLSPSKKKAKKVSTTKKKALATKKSNKLNLRKKAPLKEARSQKTSTLKKASSKKNRSKELVPVGQISMGQLQPELDNWPKDRDIVWNPERFKYLTQAKSEACVFCAAANFGVAFESLVLFKNQYTQVVLNKYPYHTGHIMVMPVRHIDGLDKLDGKEYLDIMNILRFATSIVQKVYRAEGVNIGINLGKAAGAGIPGHLHWHIIPRWYGDTNFFPSIAKTRVISENLEVTYEKLKPHFVNLQVGGIPGSGEWKQVEFKLEES